MNTIQTPKSLMLQFGQLVFTPAVVERLHELDFTVDELIEAVSEHKSELLGNPSIYCGTYAKYNGGWLCGLWIDLSTFSDFDEFVNFCRAIHADEQDPELMFQDYEEFPRELYSESGMSEADFDQILQYHGLCEQHGKEAVDDFYEFSSNLDNFEEAWCGEWDSEEDFARHIIEECYEIDREMGGLAKYFDYEAFGRDLFMWDYNMGANNNVFRVL